MPICGIEKVLINNGESLSMRTTALVLNSRKFFYSAAFEIASRCNFRCLHCYIEESERQENKAADISTKQVYQIIDKLVDFGCLSLLLTGGEPLIRADFLEIYLYAKRKGLIVDIFTNASLITPEILDCFTEHPPRMIQVSLYGINKNTFENLTQTKDLFEDIYNNLEMLLRDGFNVQLAFPILALNKNDFPKIKKYAAKRNLNLAYNPVIFPSLNGTDRPFSFVINPREAVNFDLIDGDRLKSWRNIYQRFLSQTTSYNTILCKLGDAESMAMKSIVINSRGEFDVKRYFPCLPHNYSLMGEKCLKGIYNLFLKELDYHRELSKCICKSCKYLILCCRCFNLRNTNDKNIWYFCKVAKEREKRLCVL